MQCPLEQPGGTRVEQPLRLQMAEYGQALLEAGCVRWGEQGAEEGGGKGRGGGGGGGGGGEGDGLAAPEPWRWQELSEQ